MAHLPGCGCPGPAKGPCPLDPTPADQQTAPSVAELVLAALEGRPVEQPEPTSTTTTALNDDHALKAAIIAGLGGNATSTNNL